MEYTMSENIVTINMETIQLIGKEVLATWLADLIRCDGVFQATEGKKKLYVPFRSFPPLTGYY